jgi:hypothetical protein
MTMTYPWPQAMTPSSSNTSSMGDSAKGAADAAHASTIRPATADHVSAAVDGGGSGGGSAACMLHGFRSAGSSPTKFTVVGSTSGRLSPAAAVTSVPVASSGKPSQHRRSNSKSPTVHNEMQRVLVGVLPGPTSPGLGGHYGGSPSRQAGSGGLVGHGGGVVLNAGVTTRPRSVAGGELFGGGLPAGGSMRSPSPVMTATQKRRPTSAAGVGMRSFIKEDLASWRTHKG